MSAFLKDHARIRVELVITNLLLDLNAENIDVAIRVGELQDSSVVAGRLGTSAYHLVAAPEYLKARARRPSQPI
jgi:DNA-binding transcriptional LysR family regulator